MAKQKAARRSPRDISSGSHRSPPGRAPAGRSAVYGGEIDRYHYVDRDIYSSSSRREPAKRAPAKKAGRRARRRPHGFLKALAALILCVGLGTCFYVGVMMHRMNRSDVDTSLYEEQPADAPAWSVISEDRVTNILLIGVDRGDDGKTHRSDTTMLLSIDKGSKKIRLVSFLRDLYLEIPTVGKTKLNAAFTHAGPALTMQTLENNFRINIDKYVSVDFNNFEQLIDKMGGIDVDMSAKVAKEENRVMGSHLHEGVNHLDGRLALYYARIRATDSDFGRTGRQRQVIESIIARMRELNPVELNAVMYDYLQYVETNLSDPDLLYLISLAPSLVNYEMETMHIPNDGTYEDATIKGSGMVLVPDLTENSRLLREFLYPAVSHAEQQDPPVQ